MSSNFLPLTKEEAGRRGWDELDVVLITGDAYVDHPAFGSAVIGRLLEHQGYRVGIIAMPDWKVPASVTIFGKPRLFFGVTSGNVDSMLSRYTAFKRYRSNDPYAPGGRAGLKPERAVIVYCNLIKAAYKDVPIVLGGIEASMRRMPHYDFWSDNVRRSITEDARADIVVYGMGEKAVLEIAQRLTKNQTLDGIRGTVVLSKKVPADAIMLPSEESVMESTDAFTEFYRMFYRNQHKVLAQPTAKRYLIHHPPETMETAELDVIYRLPFMRTPHPSYQEEIPAFEMIKSSVTSHRGCVSGCSFCSLTLHQGKQIVSRSPESIYAEIEKIAMLPQFDGHITDIGGPSANMYGFECQRSWHCSRESCTFPRLCPNLKLGTAKWVMLLNQAAKKKGVTNVTIGSGIRYDLFMCDPQAMRLLSNICEHHISGQLKIAPEATSPRILRAMRKIPLFSLKNFILMFRGLKINKARKQYLLPYFMTNHPGATSRDIKRMKKEMLSLFRFIPNQVQSFIPLPMTLSSVIYYTGCDPLTGERFPVIKDVVTKKKLHHFLLKKDKSKKSDFSVPRRKRKGKIW